jgi:hypothetical protein
VRLKLDKEFDVRSPRSGCRSRRRDAVGLPEPRRSWRAGAAARRSHYRASARTAPGPFHFTFRPDGEVEFEKVCDGRVWRKLEGRMSFEETAKGTRVRIEMEGQTKTLVPEFTIRGPMQDQIEQMAEARRQRIEDA